MLILIPTLFFSVWNPKSFFGQILAEKFKVVHFDWNLVHMVLPENWHTCTCTHSISKTLILISILAFSNFKPKSWGCWLVFWNSKPKSIFWTNLSQETWILYFAWKLVHRVSSGCDCKNTEQGLEEKIKMNNCVKCLLLLYLYRS